MILAAMVCKRLRNYLYASDLHLWTKELWLGFIGASRLSNLLQEFVRNLI